MHVLFLYGMPAAGKLTVARSLARLSGYKLFDNHAVVDPVLRLFEFGSADFIELRHVLWIACFRAAAKQRLNLIFTLTPEPSVPRDFVDEAVLIVQEAGGWVDFVELMVDPTEAIKRVSNDGRSNKLRDGSFFAQLVREGAFDLRERIGLPATPATVDPSASASSTHLVLDTTTLPPSEAARRICSHYKVPVLGGAAAGDSGAAVVPPKTSRAPSLSSKQLMIAKLRRVETSRSPTTHSRRWLRRSSFTPDAIRAQQLAAAGPNTVLRLCAFQGQSCSDKTINLTRMETVLREASEVHKAHLVVFPELFLTGYHSVTDAARMRELAEPLDGASVKKMARLCQELGVAACVGFAESVHFEVAPKSQSSTTASSKSNAAVTVDSSIARPKPNATLYNSAVVIDANGNVRACARKVHLFGDAEHRVFTAGGSADISTASLSWPDGLSVRIGTMLCFDVEFPELPRALALDGAEVLLVPAAEPSVESRIGSVIVPARAMENAAVVAFADTCGLVGTEREASVYPAFCWVLVYRGTLRKDSSRRAGV